MLQSEPESKLELFIKRSVRIVVKVVTKMTAVGIGIKRSAKIRIIVVGFACSESMMAEGSSCQFLYVFRWVWMAGHTDEPSINITRWMPENQRHGERLPHVSP